MHLFNTPENQSYVGPFPAPHYYMPEVMSVSGSKAFETWHAQQTGTSNFAEELVAYCESDVKLLKEGCLKFKKLFEEKSKFNSFSCMTIASACNCDLRQNRMEANNRFGTASWLVAEHKSFKCLAGMVTLGRFQVPQDSVCKKQRRISHSQRKLHGGRLRRSHQDRLRISRLFLPWLPQLLPQPQRNSPLPRRS